MMTDMDEAKEAIECDSVINDVVATLRSGGYKSISILTGCVMSVVRIFIVRGVAQGRSRSDVREQLITMVTYSYDNLSDEYAQKNPKWEP